jgi:hypothetical protein
MVDHTGHHSGNSLELIDIEKDGIVREISPKAFGPTGELAVSPDLSYFAVFSYYINAWAERSEGFWPNFHKPELLLFGKGNAQPELVIPDLKPSGAVAYLANLVLPRLSDRGSVIAIAQFGAVKVFQTTD